MPLKTDRTADLSRYADWLGWLGWLRERGGGDPDVRAVFIGGSAVTGGYDDHSDLDVEVLATPGQAVPAYPVCLRRPCATFAWQDELLAELSPDSPHGFPIVRITRPVLEARGPAY